MSSAESVVSLYTLTGFIIEWFIQRLIEKGYEGDWHDNEEILFDLIDKQNWIWIISMWILYNR